MPGKVYIVGAKRSPVGAYLGSLKDMHPADIGVQVLTKLMKEANVAPDKIDEVIVGNILPAGLGQNIARQISVKSKIPVEIPAYTINMACGSGMKAIMNAFTNIKAGYANIIVAGGVESMSYAPYLVTSRIRDGVKMGDLVMVDHVIHDALTDAFDNIHMGITAENVATKHNLTRLEQDEFALESQRKAIKAIDNAVFEAEIIPIEIKTKKETIVFAKDEYPNRTTNMEKMSKLRPAFKSDGNVTAGNASGINDGASFTIIASEEAVKLYGLKPIAEIVGIGQGGVEPNVMGLGPVPAIRNALKFASLKLENIDVIELNEAFAAQSLGVINELSEEHKVDKQALLSKTNVNGGAIALGHPVGASGNRIVTTLVHELKRQDKRYGLASLCIGGGMGTALIVKKVS